MKNLNIYLAGAMMHCETAEEMNGWRIEMTNKLLAAAEYCGCQLYITNPCDFYNFDNKIQQTELEVMQFDLARVCQSDIIVVNLEKINTSIGTAIELYESMTRKTPVIAYDPNNEFSAVHPWIQCCLTRVESDIQDLVGYLSDFYFV